jgi:ribosomal protein S18 acetylase RimI-like enzyme
MSKEQLVRLATSQDAVEIANMSREYIEHGLGWGWQPDRVQEAIQDPNTIVAVIGKRDEIIGFGAMSYDDEHAHLLLLAVRHSFQMKGVGTTIVNWLETVAQNAGIRRFIVEVRRDNLPGISFYSSLGYEIEYLKESMYRTEDGLGLEKRL